MAGDFLVDGMRYLLPQIQGRIYQIKVVCNERGAIFFPVTAQHAERCAEGIVYKEGSKGNALAGMIYRDQIELRRHDSFSEASVRAVMARLVTALSAGMDHASIERLGAYDLSYGAARLGKVGPQQKPTRQVDSRPEPHRPQ